MVARERRKRKPQPWVVLKMVIPLVFGIMGFAVYAYVSQICLPMIDKTTPTLGSRATGSESMSLMFWMQNVTLLLFQ